MTNVVRVEPTPMPLVETSRQIVDGQTIGAESAENGALPLEHRMHDHHGPVGHAGTGIEGRMGMPTRVPLDGTFTIAHDDSLRFMLSNQCSGLPHFQQVVSVMLQ